MFDYREAFSRNLGWLTELEQDVLRAKRVAVAGLGGVGGSHVLTLARLGIGNFTLSDLDQFELANFNRQAGAYVSTLEQPKLDVVAGMALDINPELDIRRFDGGVSEENINAFLEDVDIYVDSLDFFAFKARRMVFAACAERGIPAITAAPLGMGVAFLSFMPGKMTFEEYFRLDGQPEEEQALRLMLGLAPAGLHMAYLVDDSRIDFEAQKGPSTPMGCELCAGVAATQALKILLNRGQVPCAPRGLHFDAYRNKLSKTWRPWGNRNPLQQLMLGIARKRIMARPPSPVSPPQSEAPAAPINRVLERGRWAPSGDNEQPWRFEIVDDFNAVIHAHDTRNWCVYDLDGTSSQIAVGALLETLSLAASATGLTANFRRRPDTSDEALEIGVSLQPDETAAADPLAPFIEARVTQRRPFTTRPLAPAQRQALERAVGEGYRVIWLEGKQRAKMAKLLFHNAHIRLTTPEAWEVHRRNIEWGARFSEDRLPEYALGVDRMTGKVMRWVLASWQRVRTMNRFFAGTWPPRLQMDLLPGMRCAAHFVIVADQPLAEVDDYIAGGRAMQRFWLEATRQGLQFQPAMTPVIFSRYVTQGRKFTEVTSETELARQLAARLDDVLGPDQDALRRVFMGRVGFGTTPDSRSTRLPLASLLHAGDSNA